MGTVKTHVIGYGHLLFLNVNCLRSKIVLILCLLCSKLSFSQYILNGSAEKINCNCYTLTQQIKAQSGSVWNSNKISLNSPFDFWFNVFLGCSDGGADGIVFILQPISTSVGTSGEGMGFEGVSPSIGIALDTYQNTNQNDPWFDHISIQANGNVNHNNDLVAPVPISATDNNVEDCKWHVLRISWDPSTKWLRSYFDGVLRVEKQIDLVANIFNNDPNVFWGFTGATGGEVNLQQFCTALNPIVGNSLSIDTTCVGTSIQFTSQSESFAPITDYTWSFGDGSGSNDQNTSHTYSAPGTYPVNLKIRGQDGCENDTTRTIVVASDPYLSMDVFDTCYSHLPRIDLNTNSFGITYQWNVDGNFNSLKSGPDLNNLPVGNHSLDLTVNSLYGCGSSKSASTDFTIKPIPEIEAQTEDGCINTPVSFGAAQTDNTTTINNWNWNFGDNKYSQKQNLQHTYTRASQYDVSIYALATNGCSSDTIQKTITISDAFASAGNDTTIIRNFPFQLHGQGNSSNFQWTPSTGLSNPGIADPIVTISQNENYVLTVTTTEGCIAKDTIHIKAIEGPNIYVASAFTPNGDGLNDVLHPVYVGMTRLERFAVFNRWGQNVFSTTDMYKGWDGTFNGQLVPGGTYVWFAKAENYLHQTVTLKGTVSIVR